MKDPYQYLINVSVTHEQMKEVISSVAWRLDSDPTDKEIDKWAELALENETIRKHVERSIKQRVVDYINNVMIDDYQYDADLYEDINEFDSKEFRKIINELSKQ